FFWGDQSLRPEVQKAFAKTAPPLNETQRQAYAYVTSFPDRQKIWSQDDPDSLPRYIKLMEFGEGGSPPSQSLEELIDPAPLVPDRIHLAFVAQLSAWLKQGGQARVYDLVELSNHYYAGFFHNGSLSDRTTALENMLLNARLL